MTHIANQRIKKDGKTFAPGDPITLNASQLKALPEGAVTETSTREVPEPPAGLDGTQAGQLKAAVGKLKDEAFKQDGEIRAGALKHLNDKLGFAVTAADVAAIKVVQE